MKNKKIIIIYFLILFFAAFLRLYNLSEVPAGVNRDEASIGYTAYSLLQTGRDEYGRLFPISFQSFGDWKLPLYIYTTVIFVKILNLSELAVRLPSALFGLTTVGLSFFLVREMFRTEVPMLIGKHINVNKLAILIMGLLAISPWHLHLSRVESESNTAVFLITLGLILFLKALKGRRWLFLPSFLLFSLTYYTYAGNHIFTTLFVLGLLFIYRKKILWTKITYFSLFIFVLSSAFIFYNTILTADKTKISGISIFGDPSVVHSQIELIRKDHVNNPLSIQVKFIHNKLVYGFEKIFQNYLNSYSPSFLFIKGGENKAHNIPNFGNIYLIEAPFLLLGIVYLFLIKGGKEKNLILWWLFIAPIAASITKDAPHSNRMFAIFPILPFVTAFGIIYFVSIFKKYKNLLISIMILLFLLNFSIYLDRYYVHFPYEDAAYWGTGYKNLNEILSKEKYSNRKIIISRPETSPYIFLLFYSKFGPKKYQETAVRYPMTSDGFVNVKSYGNYEFRQINWSKDIDVLNRILVDEPFSISDFTKKQSYPTEKVILPNGETMFYVININKKKSVE